MSVAQKGPAPAVALAVVAGMALPFSGKCVAQSLADYAFIEWSATADISEPTSPDAAYIDLLRAAQDSYAYREAAGSYRFLASGDIERTQRLVIDYADSAGIDAQGNATIYVNSYSDRLIVDEAYVTTADGQITTVDPQSVQVLLEDDRGVFTNDHAIVIPWPTLAPGAVSTLSYRLVTRGDRLAAPWSRISFPQSFAPTREYELLVTWEQGMTAPVVASDADQVQCRQAALSMRCTARDVIPAPIDGDVNYLDELGHVIVAEDAGWIDIANLLRSYVVDSWTDEQAVAAVVESVLEGKDTEIEKLRALHSFVAEQIRYVGVETGVNGVVPHETGLVLSRRYGDCKDKTALFLQMAEIAGLSAYPVVVSSNRKNRDRLIAPGLAYFDHMVACIDTAEDGTICIDLTDPYTPAFATPSFLDDAVALPLKPGSTGTMQLDSVPFAWAIDVRSDNVIDGSTVHETERRTFGPDYSGTLRGMLAGLDRSEITRWAREQYEDVFDTDASIEFDLQGLEDQQSPVIIESSASFENAIMSDQPLHYEHRLGWLIDLASSFHSTNEYYDYRFVGFGYRDETRFVLGEWKLVAPGADIQFVSEFGTMDRRYRLDNGVLTIETLLNVPARVIPQDRIERFNQFLDTVIENSVVRFRARP